MNEFSNKLKSYRTTLNMTQSELAEKLYVTRQAVSRWENGSCIPDINTVKQIADIFNITTDDLLSVEPNAIKLKTLENETSVRKLRRMSIPVMAVLCVTVAVMSVFLIKALINVDRLTAKQNSLSFTAERADNKIIEQNINIALSDYSLNKTVDWISLFYCGFAGGNRDVKNNFCFVGDKNGENEIKIKVDKEGIITNIKMPDIYMKAYDQFEEVRYSSVYSEGIIYYVKTQSPSVEEWELLYPALENNERFVSEASAFLSGGGKEFVFVLSEK